MKIGVCIPFFDNSEEARDRIEYLLDTIRNQDNLTGNLEVVVVVDGPKEEFLEKYNNKFAITIMETEKHVGVSAARNVGLDFLQQKGCSYIGFIDADDSISDDYLIEAFTACLDNEYDLLDARFIQGIEVFGTFKDIERQKQLVRNGVVGTFIKSSVIGNIRFNETMLVGEDSDFMNRVIDLKRHKKGIFRGMYVYNFGVNPNSIIMRANQNRLN